MRPDAGPPRLHAPAPPTGSARPVLLALVSGDRASRAELAPLLTGEALPAGTPTGSPRGPGRLLMRGPAGDRLVLLEVAPWSQARRLLLRLRVATRPLGGGLRGAWHRWSDGAAWRAQVQLRQALPSADVVLFLVPALGPPGASAELAAELEILRHFGRPVVALVSGPPPTEDADEAVLGRRHRAAWLQRLHAAGAPVRAVLATADFNACWVQEGVLWQAVARLLPTARQPGFERLRSAWNERRQGTWRAAMDELARRITRAALDREALSARRGAGDIGSAGAALSARLQVDVRRSRSALLALQGLPAGRLAALAEAAAPVVARLPAGPAVPLRLTATLTPMVAWDPAALDRLIAEALVDYLALAHDGRSPAAAGEPPGQLQARWAGAVALALLQRRPTLARLWQHREALVDGQGEAAARAADGAGLNAALYTLLQDACAAVLAELYPQAEGLVPV